jgi:cytochrome c peroxidase
LFGNLAALLTVVGVASGCGAVPSSDGSEDISQAVTEDALAQAYGVFKAQFTALTPGGLPGEDKVFHVGFGFHPGLTTSKITIDQTLNAPVSGIATIDFNAGVVTAKVKGPKAGTQFAGQLFDLWFVKNKTGSVKPEAGDQWMKVGTTVAGTDPNQPNVQNLTANIGKAPFPANGVNFDTDLLVLTNKGTIDPTTNIVATGEITLFEKRFFRERAGRTLDAVTGTLSNSIETTDPLVRRGAQIFFNEKFAGNGRTCGTCHRAENNLTIDAAFIAAKLPPSSNDPLFTNLPDGLEDLTLVRQGLIRENIDGFDQATSKFVMRGVPHTLSLGSSIGEVITVTGGNDGPGAGIPGGSGFVPEPSPPDQKTGWSGDGAPGRGTLHEFAFGAVVQHFTLSLSRFVGSSFRIPTQAELDALEAFQLFTGRQKNANTAPMNFGDAAANRGRDIALGGGQCVACHRDLVGNNFLNFNGNTGIEGLIVNTSARPKDGGFGTVNGGNGPQVPGSIAAGFGNGQFNPPPLVDAADTAPFFHNSAVATIEDAVLFYRSNQFVSSPANAFAKPSFDDQGAKDIAAFLRTANALENIAQVRKRCQHVQNVRSSGNTAIINVAIEDVQDAIDVLTTPNLAGATQGSATNGALNDLRTVKQALQTAAVVPDDQRGGPAGYMVTPLAFLATARTKLLPGNPNNEF